MAKPGHIRLFRSSIGWFLILFMCAIPCHGMPAHDQEETRITQSKGTIHPRLYLDEDKVKRIRTSLDKYPYTKFWRFITAKADQYATESAPITAEHLNDATIRQLGDRIPYIAIAYLLTGQKKYLEGTRRWMNALSSYPDWASNHDIGAAHLLFGMSVAYDWLYNNWTAVERTRFRTKISKHAQILYIKLTERNIWWARPEYLLQNHNYTNVMALAVAGIALQQEDRNADAWLKASENNFRKVLEVLSPDGASHEGIGYWGYGTTSLLKYFLADQRSAGKMILKENPFFRNTALFRLYASLPDYVENVDFADSPRSDWNGPGFILRALASVFKDGHAQWLAERIEKARNRSPKYSWLDLIWYDKSVSPIPPDDLPLHAYFDNLGIFINRSDWTDHATWTFFKAGPSQGKLAESKGIYTGSHIHPDAGNFLLWSEGWLVVDDGYVYRKRTENHNVPLFNGKGQLGEGGKWFDPGPVKQAKGTSKIVYTDLKKNYQYLVADIGSMYPPDAGIKQWERTFIALPFGRLVIRDRVIWRQPGKLEEKIHLSQLPRMLGEHTACLSDGSGLMVTSLLPKQSRLSVDTFKIPENELTRYANSHGGLLKVDAENARTIILLFDPDIESCTVDQSPMTLSSEHKLVINSEEQQITINFMGRTVEFGQ